ncbi:MAG: hypothetical protein NTY45_00185 [Elusimicrobia bacterium]|nr:hypothetical protein [Elusimicrobiota bacterium]
MKTSYSPAGMGREIVWAEAPEPLKQTAVKIKFITAFFIMRMLDP